ncbi:MAG: hypothetical protein IJ368_02910 [Oscillospiraceae bacterium]|nr:hypothetical protein [Oscillospiraceae bacterium]
MKNRAEHNLILRAAAAAVSALFLTACGNSGDTAPESFTIISDGTSMVTEVTTTEQTTEPDKYAGVSETQLYVPQHMVTKYASLDYDERMQDVYNEVVDTMVSFKEKSFIPLTISVEDYVRVLETVRCEQLMLFYLQNRSAGDFNNAAKTYEMNFSYKYSIKDVNIMLMKTEEAAAEIMQLVSRNMSDYEKVKIFHDYLVLNVESSTDNEFADSIYGALVEKKALCEGYAKAFSYLCNIAGIENMIVTGYTDVDHMWNMVRIDDSWYHVDVGWDKPAAALAEKYPDMVMYQYFLADDTVIENNRIISNMLCDPPKADNDSGNYFVAEEKYAYDYEQALEIIEDCCRRCVDTGDKYFMLKLDSSNLYLQTTSQLIKPDENGVSDIDKMMERMNYHGKISYIDYYKGYRIIIFVME